MKLKTTPRAIAYGIALMLLLMAFVLSAVSCDFLSDITDNTPTQDTPGKDEPGQNEPGKDESDQDEPGQNEPGKDESDQDEPTVEPNYKWEFVPTSGYYYGEIPDEIERIDGYIAVLSSKTGDDMLIRAHSIEIPTDYEGKPVVGLTTECPSKTTIILDFLTIPSSIRWIDEFFFAPGRVIEVYNQSALTIEPTTPYYISPQSIITDKNESKLTQKDGFVFYEDKGEASLVGYIGSKTDLILPEKSVNGNYYEIEALTFASCNLTSIVLPEGMTRIEDRAFLSCERLERITIPSSVTSIGSFAFYGCGNLNAVYITDLEAWCGIKFEDNSSNPLSNKYKIGYVCELFINGGLVTDITIPAGMTSIGDFAFSGCSGLTSITIPSSVTSIGDYAFDGCSGLTSITIPSSVTSIGFSAFEDCDKLIEVCNKSSLNITAGSSDNGYIGYYAKHIITDEKDSALSEKNSYVFYDDGSDVYLVSYRGTDTELIFPEKSPKGKDYAINRYAFYNCSSLTSITIPSSVTSIGDSAFEDCSSLESITIPSSVKNIGNYAFYNCSNLKTITFAENSQCSSIGVWAFEGCSSFTSITFQGTKTQWNAISKGTEWNWYTGSYTIHCTDGDI